MNLQLFVSRRAVVLTLALAALIALSGCGLFNSNNSNAKPTPTLPFPTNVVVTPGAGQPTSAPQGGNTVSLGGDVFNDSNGNGAKDDGEPIIAGVIVQLASGDCPGTVQAQTTSTAASPSYKFDGLSSGGYCVAIDAGSPQNAAILGQGQWTVPQTAQGVITQAVNLKKNPKTDVDFGWTFAAIGEATPAPEQPTSVAEQPTAVPPPLIPTPTPFVNPTAGPAPCVFKAAYIQDVTIPDGTVVAPGAQFVKTWRVQNTGTCLWGPGSRVKNLSFDGGDPLGAPNLVPILSPVIVGGTADLSINMVAPTASGTYKSNWRLRTDDGSTFGVGPYNAALYAQIRVQAAVPPTAVPPPTVPPPPVAQPIKFAPGATEAEAQGSLPTNGIATYSLAAQAGQNMALTLSSNSSTARISVTAPSGAPLPPQRGNPEGTYWQGTLPATGTYILQVLAGNGAATANYSMDITIPVRITFAPGAISAQVQGTTNQNRIVTYLLKANAGQTMTVNLNAPANSAGITIYGSDDGQPLIRSQSGATSFNGQLPGTQDYVIQVVPFIQGQVNFTLNITVQ